MPCHFLVKPLWRITLAAGLAATLGVAAISSSALAQDKGAEAQPAQKLNQADGEDQPAAEEDPFAIPEDASVEELFAFMDKTKRVQPKQRDAKSMTELAKKVFPAIIAAADLVLEKSDKPEDITKAVSTQFEAYGILSRFDKSVQPKVKELAAEYAQADNPALAAIAVGYLLNEKVSSLRTASTEEAEAVAGEVLDYLKRFGLTKATYGTATGIASSLGYSDHQQVAANLYENLVPFFRESDDPQLVDRADMMMGAARRMRLINNPMEVFGTTADGKEFAWSDYRGKVVLVDFWASWCGPCIGELPNMKKNLKLYGDKGFAIVGINMDSTREAFEKCVDSKEITWVNLVSEEEGLTGWKAPMATHYGITGIPTAILVDQQGTVVSLGARGTELDKQLQRLLGPIEVEVAAGDAEEASQKASDDK